MTAFEQLVTSLVTGGMDPGAAASLVARAVIEATAKEKTSGAARTARWRERHKTSQNVTGASSLSTVTVTSQASQSVTSNAAADQSAPLSILPSVSRSGIQEVSKEKKKEGLSSEPRARRGARLPDDWRPSSDDWNFARARGLSDGEIEVEATKFRNYWTNRTDRQAAKPRWDRAWENWILNVRGKLNGTDERSRSKDDFRAALREVGAFARGGGAGAATVQLLPAAGRGRSEDAVVGGNRDDAAIPD